jgi:ABC-2 type transport system permease protein
MTDAHDETMETVESGAASSPGRRSAAKAAEASRRMPAGSERFNPLWELTLARVREFVREPEALFWVFVFPVLLAFALGIAFRNTAPEKNRIAIEADPANPAVAQQLAASLNRSPDIQAFAFEPTEAARALRTGKVALVVRGASGQGSSSNFEYRFDPTRPESRVARLAADDALQRHLGRADVAAVTDDKITEPGARYIDFLIPGLIGLNLMGSGMWGLGFAVVQARTRKLLKRLAATPMRRSHYLLSFMFSRLIFLVLEVVAVIAFAWLVFKVSVQGSLIDVAIISLIGAMTFAGLGMLVAARPRTIEGVSGLMNLVMLPMWLLSGTFFSASRFPDIFQPFIKALPLTALNDSLRSVMSDGAPLANSLPAIGVMVAWCLISFALALKLFRWQ